MASCHNYFSGISDYSRNSMKGVFGCIVVSNESEEKIYITWARCGSASLVGATHCPCSEPSEI